MNLRPILLGALVLCAGCQYSEMRDEWDEASALQKQGRKAVRTERFVEGADLYSKSAKKYEAAYDIARERKSGVLVSHLGAELSIVAAAQASCVRPDHNPDGSWKRAYELYATSGMWATEVTMLKLQRNAKHMQAFCVRPDNNPKGSWEKAAKLYKEGVAMAETYQKDEDQAEGLREWALCLLHGDKSKLDQNAQARKLLIKARNLGDEEAAEILASSKVDFCSACGAILKPGARYCSACGQDQTVKPKPKVSEPDNQRPRNQIPEGQRGPGPAR